MQNSCELIKVCIIGPSKAGKSTILCSIKSKNHSDKYMPTIGVDFGDTSPTQNKKITYWDTSNDEPSSSLLGACLRNSRYILVVFSKYDREEFQNISKYLQNIKQYVTQYNAEVLLIANNGLRSDQTESDAITDEEIAEILKAHNIAANRYFQINAINKDEVDAICTLIHNETKKPFSYERATLEALSELQSYAAQDAQELHKHISEYYTNEEYRSQIGDGQSSLRNNSQTKKHIQNLQLQSILVSILNFITALVLHTVFLPISLAYYKIYKEDNLFKRNRENKGSACMFFDFAPKQKAQIAVHLAEKDYMNFNQ